jgi:hypothetical protein
MHELPRRGLLGNPQEAATAYASLGYFMSQFVVYL